MCNVLIKCLIMGRISPKPLIFTLLHRYAPPPYQRVWQGISSLFENYTTNAEHHGAFLPSPSSFITHPFNSN